MNLQVHENEIMRAYKTVNDIYIEPISFTVPRKSEAFQSDIYPPAVGVKPAVSAAEWLGGESGIPAKIDLESVYKGNEPVEVASDYKPNPAPAPVSVSAASKPVPQTQSSPVVRSLPPHVADQKGSIAVMASKYKEEEEEKDEDADETHSFEEVRKPLKPTLAAASAGATGAPASAFRAASPAKATPPTVTTRRAASPIKAAPAPSVSASGNNEAQITKLISLVESQTKLLLVQDTKINRLMDEVDKLQKASATAASQSEKIRQIELQLEAMDS